MRLGTIELDHVRGFGDKLVGLGKEWVGTVTHNERLVKEGETQQARGAEHLKSLRAQAKAQAKETAAKTHEQRQRAAQHVKESA
jgi:uncharacterized protein YjbJ (UPF0337 family)